MSHKTLTISEDAYESLARLKKPGESFTDVINRITRQAQKKPLSEFAGKLLDEDFERAVTEIRRSSKDLSRMDKVKL